MGSSRERVVERQTSSTTPQRFPEEQELSRLELERQRAVQPQVIGTQQAGLGVVEDVLRGDIEDLPIAFQRAARGIDPEVTTGLTEQALRDLNFQLAKSGVGTFLESGAAQAIGARTAGDIRRASEEFNIGAFQNLLNLALGGQAQVQQPVLQGAANLGSRLAALTPTTTTGSATRTTSTPFLQSPFVTSLAGGFGRGFGGAFGQNFFSTGDVRTS